MEGGGGGRNSPCYKCGDSGNGSYNFDETVNRIIDSTQRSHS